SARRGADGALPDRAGEHHQRCSARGSHRTDYSPGPATGRIRARRDRQRPRIATGCHRADDGSRHPGHAGAGRTAGRVVAGGAQGDRQRLPRACLHSDEGVPMIRVVIADDQQLIRGGFRSLLESEPDIEVVGEAGTGVEAVAVVAREKPDVVLMDIRMPDGDGLWATEQLVADSSLAATRIVVVTTFELDDYVAHAIRAGASGFLVKDTEPVELIRAVRVVAGGDALLSPG